MLYHDPHTVVNPRSIITARHVLYDGGENGFSLARVVCEGLDHIGFRWNVAIKELDDERKHNGELLCNGSPAARGVPSWFILPRELFNPVLFDENSEGFMAMVAGGFAKQGN